MTALRESFERYLPDTGFAPLGLRVISCGHWQRPAVRDERNSAWTADCFGLLMIERDGGYLATDRSARRELGPGARFMLFPGIRHHYGPHTGQDWIEWHLLCDGPFLDRLAADGLLDATDPVLGDGDPAIWRERWRALLDCAKSGDAHGLVAAAMELWLRAAWRPAASAPDNPVDGLAAAIRREPFAHVDMTREARRCGLSVSGLRQAFCRRHGLPIYRFQQRHRVDLAVRLIAEGMPAKEAGAHVGYPDLAHFSRVFRRVTGRSIRDFRRSVALVANGPR